MDSALKASKKPLLQHLVGFRKKSKQYNKTDNTKKQAAILALGVSVILVPVIWLSLKRTKSVAAAEQVAISSTASQIQIDVPNRYTAVLQKGDTDDFLVFSDRAEDDTTPDNTHEFKGPCILASSTSYCIRDDENRNTIVIEASKVRVKVKVIGRFADETTTGYLQDGSSNDISAEVEYTFTPDGVFVKNTTDMQGGLTFDTDSGHNGYEWLGVYTDVTDTAFDDTGNIIYGDGNTEGTTNTDGSEFEDVNKYVVLNGSGTSTYQDSFIGIMSNGWYNDTGGVDEWHWDIAESGTQDLLATQEQNYTSSGEHVANWFFLLLPETDLDTETKREHVINNYRSPDTLAFFDDGSTGIDNSGNSYNSYENAYIIDLDTTNARFGISGGDNLSTLLNGAVSAGVTSITVDSTTGFPSVGVAYIGLDKFTYTGTTATTFTGIPASGDDAVLAHADNEILSLMNRHNPFFEMHHYRSILLPDSLGFDNDIVGTDHYNIALKPITKAIHVDDLLFYSRMESSTSITSPDIGAGGSFGASTTTGKYGNGILINGNNDDTTIPLSGNVDPDAGAVEFWYQDTAGAAAGAAFFNSTEGAAEFRLQRQGSGTDLDLSINNTTANFSVNIDVFDGTLHHIRVEYDTINDVHELLIDGISQSVDTTAMNAITIGAYDLIFGLDHDGAGFRIDGVLDEFKIYSGANVVAKGGDTSDTEEYLADETNDYTFDLLGIDSSSAGDYFFLGSEEQFGGLAITLETEGILEGGNMVWEYWTGTDWSTLSINNGKGAANLVSDGVFHFTPPANWSKYSLSNAQEYYYIRGHLENGASYQVSPIEDTIKTDILLLQHFDAPAGTDLIYSIPANYQTADFNKGSPPVSVWLLDEGSGATTHDSTEEGNDLTITGASWSTDNTENFLNRTYLSFDGSGDYLSRTNDGDFNFGTDSFTFTLNFRATSTPSSGTATLLSHYGTAGYKAYMTTDGYICFAIDDDSTWTPDDIACSDAGMGNLADSNWHHVAIAKDSTSSIKLYIDGLLAGQDTTLLSIGSLDTSSTFYVGIDSDGSSNPWSGDINSIYLYDYARAQRQIQTDRTTPATTSFVGNSGELNADANIVGWWRFDEASQQTVYDAGTGNNTGIRGTTSSVESSDPVWKTLGECSITGCLEFDGTDDVVTIADDSTISLDNDLAAGFTISSWVFVDSDGEANTGTVFSKNAGTYLRVENESGGRVDLIGSLALASTNASHSVSSALSVGEWHHVGLSYTDDGDDEITLWIDGIDAGTSTNGSGSPAADIASLSIGGPTAANFDGKIDDFKVYDAELTTEQMAVNANANAAVNFGNLDYEKRHLEGGAGNNLVGYWAVNENSGTSSTYDLSNNNNTGTLNGSMTEDDWVKGHAGSALELDGTDDFIDMGSGPGTVNSIAFWVYPETTTEYFVNLTGTSDYIWVNTGTVTATGVASPTVYVDGVQTSTLVAGKWQHIVVTTSTSETTNNLEIGRTTDSNYLEGKIDEVKLWDYELSNQQVAYEYNRGEPYGWWRFDECTGTTLYDAGSGSHNATLTIGASGTNLDAGECNTGTTSDSWENGLDGKYNSSLDLDGTDDYASISDTSNLRFDAASADFSIMAWIQRDTSGATHYVLSKEDADNDGWYMQITSSNTLQCGLNGTDVVSSNTIADNNWHHVACTFDRGGNGQTYIDGRSDGTAVSVSSISLATTSSVVIGTRAYSSTNYFEGQIDEVRIYNYHMSSAQVQSAMNFGRASFGFE